MGHDMTWVRRTDTRERDKSLRCQVIALSSIQIG